MCIFCERAKAEADGEFDPSTADAEPRLRSSQQVAAESCSTLRSKRTPVTIITGFLGSGKTTLLNHILHSQHGLKLAVLENEIGDVSIDDELLPVPSERTEGPEVVLLPNGCMCCRTRGDLSDALKRLVQRQTEAAGSAVHLDGIILELSGAAEVAPVLQTFFADPYVQGTLQLDAVLCVCDAVRLGAALTPPHAAAQCNDSSKHSDAASGSRGSTAGAQGLVIAAQLALADKILLNKTDLVSAAELASLRTALAHVNASAAVLPCVRGAVDVAQLLNTSAFSLAKVLQDDEDFLGACFPSAAAVAVASSNGHHHHGTAAEQRSHQQHENAAAGTHEHKSHSHAHGSEQHPRRHAHVDLGLQTVGVEVTAGAVDSVRALSWLRTAVSQHSEAIWRIKGVLWAGPASGHRWGADQRIVLQGLGGHLEVDSADWPTGRLRRSRVILIGPFSAELLAELKQGLHESVAVAAVPSRAAAVVAPVRAAVSAVTSSVPQPTAAAVSSFGGMKAAAKRGGRSEFDDFF